MNSHPYVPFWREEPFTERENELLSALATAHAAVALRGNASGEVFRVAYLGSGDYTKAIIAALATLGAVHGPIEETYEFVQYAFDHLDDSATCHPPLSEARRSQHVKYKTFSEGLKDKVVPGWGNSLVKGKNDPAFTPVREALRAAYKSRYVAVVNRVTNCLHMRYAKHIYPNPSCWTAVVAIAIGMPKEVSPYLFVAARLAAWSKGVL